MAVTNYDEIESISVKNLVADWRRLQIANIVLDERTAKQMSQHCDGKVSGCFCMRFGFDYGNPKQLIAVLIDQVTNQIQFDPVQYEGPTNKNPPAPNA